MPDHRSSSPAGQPPSASHAAARAPRGSADGRVLTEPQPAAAAHSTSLIGRGNRRWVDVAFVVYVLAYLFWVGVSITGAVPEEGWMVIGLLVLACSAVLGILAAIELGRGWAVVIAGGPMVSGSARFGAAAIMVGHVIPYLNILVMLIAFPALPILLNRLADSGHQRVPLWPFLLFLAAMPAAGFVLALAPPIGVLLFPVAVGMLLPCVGAIANGVNAHRTGAWLEPAPGGVAGHPASGHGTIAGAGAEVIG